MIQVLYREPLFLCQHDFYIALRLVSNTELLLFWCKVEVKIVVLYYHADIFLRDANPISDDFVNMCQVEQAFNRTLVRNSRNSDCNQYGCNCLCEAGLNG